MSANLLIVAPGLATTVQDEGRRGWQRFGVPVSGALDPVALAAANIVAGNAPTTAGLECLYQGPVFEVAADSVRLAVAGAGAALEIVDEPARRIPALESVSLSRGQRVRVAIAGPAISAYLAICGGIDVPLVAGSRSTYVRAGLGGLHGRALVAGDRVPLLLTQAPSGPDQSLADADIDLAPARIVRIVPGPQWERFTAAAHATLTSATYAVLPASDRMGLRLDGPRLEHTAGADIVSDAIPPGAIQVPGDGRPIVMLADRQTTGGYTKIATVISADLPALGRIGPGAELVFRTLEVAEAEAIRRAQDARIASWHHRLTPVRSAADPGHLMTANLVSGVVDAAGEPDVR